jgi:hypothetical protein
MNDRVEHLIERAAAKLREAGAVPAPPAPATDGARPRDPAPLSFQPLPVPSRAEPPVADANADSEAGKRRHASLPELDVSIPRPPEPSAHPPSAYSSPAFTPPAFTPHADDDILP